MLAFPAYPAVPAEMKFLDCPTDVILRLIESMDPLDIISLSQTCWALHGVCDDMTVWKDIVRRIRAQNHIFPVALDPHESTSLPDLHHEATAPARFVSLLTHALRTTGEIVPVTSDEYIDANPEVEFNAIHLLPGGKILIVASNVSLFIVKIHNTPSGLTFEKVYEWDYEMLGVVGVSSAPENSIRIAGIMRQTGGTSPTASVQIGIFEYDFSTCAARMKCRSDDAFGRRVNQISGDSFFYAVDGAIYEWNFITDQRSVCAIAHDDYEEIILPSGLHSDLIILISQTRVYAYRLQELRNPLNHTSEDIQDPPTSKPLKPVLIMDIPRLPDDLGLLNHPGQSRWRRQSILHETWPSHLSLSFYAFTAEDDDPFTYFPDPGTYSCYRIHLDRAQYSGEYVEALYTDVSYCVPGDILEILPTRKAQDALFESWLYIPPEAPSRLAVAFNLAGASLPKHNHDGTREKFSFVDVITAQQPRHGTMFRHVEDVYEFSLDPVSGRMCYLNSHEPNFIGIVDYLRLPRSGGV